MPPLPDVKNITQYPEFEVFKRELIKFCDKIENISDIQLDSVTRVTVMEEILGRRWAAEKVREFLVGLGVLKVGDIKRDKTYE